MCFVFAIFSQDAQAQESNILNSLRGVPQGNQINPAREFKAKWYMGIPVLSSTKFRYKNNDMLYNDVFELNQYDSLTIRNQHFLDQIDDNAGVEFAQSLEIFNAGYRMDKQQFTFNVTAKNYQRIDLSEGLFRLALEGNAAYLGENMNIMDDYTKVDICSYLEIGLGYSTAIDDQWRVGGRVKYLIGTFNARTEQTQASIYTDPDDYSLRLNSNFLMNLSSPIGSDEEFADGDFELGSIFKNSGFGVDLGVTYQWNDKLDLGFSVKDLGFITWNANPRQFRSIKENGEFSFDGFDVNDVITDSKFNEDTFDDFVDDLKEELDIKDMPGKKYTTSLHTEFLLEGQYTFNEYHAVGAYANGLIWDDEFRTSLSTNYIFNYKFLGVSAGNTIGNGHFFNPGAGIYLKGGAFQFYAVFDTFNSLYLTNLKSFSTTIGFNLIFK